jgi:hypothetical protein
MSWYIDGSKSVKVDGVRGEWWVAAYEPGTRVPVSGIYRCLGCNKEIASNVGDPFPPQNHHQHELAHGPILCITLEQGRPPFSRPLDRDFAHRVLGAPSAPLTAT